MKKSLKKNHSSKQTRRSHISRPLPFVSFKTFVIILGVLLLVVGVQMLSSLTHNVHVLGTSTQYSLLAEGNSSNRADQTESVQQQHDSQQSQLTDQHPARQPDQQLPPQQQNTQQPAITADTQVDCVNPETGQHFTTSFHTCQEINQKAGSAGFRFTPLTNPTQKTTTEGIDQQMETHQEATSPAHTQLEMQTAGNKGEVTMETPGLQIQVKREDNGSVHLTAVTADGKEIKLEANALNQLNQALEDKGVAVATSASSPTNLVLRQKGVEAETELPLSVDPATHQLTVTTPSGVKTVTVLPDQAIQNVLSNKVLSSVETQVSSTSGGVNQVSTLTELNNQPVFAINGVTQKNLLGLFPVGFAKTAYVSATDGNVVQVNESFFNRFLESLSF